MPRIVRPEWCSPRPHWGQVRYVYATICVVGDWFTWLFIALFTPQSRRQSIQGNHIHLRYACRLSHCLRPRQACSSHSRSALPQGRRCCRLLRLAHGPVRGDLVRHRCPRGGVLRGTRKWNVVPQRRQVCQGVLGDGSQDVLVYGDRHLQGAFCVICSTGSASIPSHQIVKEEAHTAYFQSSQRSIIEENPLVKTLAMHSTSRQSVFYGT